MLELHQKNFNKKEAGNLSDNISLIDHERDLSFYASRGLDKNYFEILNIIEELYQELDEKTRIERKKRLFENSLLSLSIESKYNSPNIAKEIIDKVDDKTLVNSIQYCFRTKEINEEIIQILYKDPWKIINGSVDIDVEIAIKEIGKIIYNSSSIIKEIAQYINPESLKNLPIENKEYITKKIPKLDIYTPEEIIENIIINSDDPTISIIVDHLINYLEQEFTKFNNKNKNDNLELYLGDYILENKHVLKIVILAYENEKDVTIEFQIILKNPEFVVLINSQSKKHFVEIGTPELQNLHKVITKQIYNGKTKF